MGVSNGFAAPAKLMPLDILANVGTIRAVVTEAAGVPGPPGFPIKVALKICVRFTPPAPVSSTPIDADTPFPNSQV
jgi:hypothetical protein